MLGSFRLHGHGRAHFPPLSGSAPSALSCTPAAPAAPSAVRSGRRAAVRPDRTVAASPESATGPQRRFGGSTYAALAHGRVDAEALRNLLARHRLHDGEPIYAVDVSTWPRCDAETSPERGFYNHPSGHSAGQPLHPLDNHNQAVIQIRALLTRLAAGEQAVPLFVFDAGYDPCSLGLRWPIRARRSWSDCARSLPLRRPATRPPSPKGGRPRRHGAKLDTGDPATWPSPTVVHIEDDDHYGRVTVRAWAGLHPKQQLHPTRGTMQPRPIVRGTLVRVQVSRIPANTRPPQVLWLWWQGCGHGTGDAVARLRAPVRPGARFALPGRPLRAAGFRNFGARSVHPPSHRYPAAAPQDGRPAATQARPDATRRYPAIKKAA